ncbi:hypothetical protein [Peptostreptococcus porci]|uniref:hypothetical protein n=1 Tax=Peptostreptococcus porci TaxID=2652282 RepID=UPI002A759684|nr:hypothetical protein [Peptostreptococcus porci]MDY2795381.1 hypothetical protein [Peptostreptococcus porci]
MKRFEAKWKKLSCMSRIEYILVGILFLIIPIEGLIFESFNVTLVDYKIVLGIYILAIVISLLSRQWKLALIVIVGGILVLAITIGLSEVLGYYLKEWFGIDISHR